MHQDRDRAKELAKKSIAAWRKAAAESRAKAEIVPPKSPEELVDQLAQVFAEVKNGQLD